MPPPSLSTTTMRQVDAPRPTPSSPLRVVQERDVTEEQRGRSRASVPRASATPTAVETTPSMPLAPRLARTRSRPWAPRTTRRRGRASTTRRRAPRRRAGRRTTLRAIAGSCRLGVAARTAARWPRLRRRRRGPRSGRSHAVGPGPPGRRSETAAATDRAGIRGRPPGQRRRRRRGMRSRVVAGAVERDGDLPRVEAGQPLAQHLRGRRRPSRSTTSGANRCATGRHPEERVEVRHGRRSGRSDTPLRGSASTGQPSRSARSRAPPRDRSMPPPATITPRRRRRPPRSQAVDGRPSGRRRHRRQCRGSVARAAGRRPGSPTSGSRKGRFRWTGPGRPIHRGHATCGGQRPPRPTCRLVGDARVDERPHRAPEEVRLVDRSGAPHAVQLGRSVGRAHQQRHPGLVGLDHRGVQLDRRGAAGGDHERRTARARPRPSAMKAADRSS